MNEEKKYSFFKKVIISIKNIEKYPELASKNWVQVLDYIFKLIIIFAIFATFAFMYSEYKKFTNETIVDQNQKVNAIQMLTNILKEYYTGDNDTLINIGMFIIAYLEILLTYLINVAVYVLLLGGFGYFTAIILRLHLRFSAMCKIAIHSLTLPIILEMIYLVVKATTGFEIKYFEIMYFGISYIYIISTILMIKSDVIKNREELAKIIEEQEKIRQELERKKQEEEEKKEEKKKQKEREEQKKKEKKKEKETDNESNEAQGENA